MLTVLTFLRTLTPRGWLTISLIALVVILLSTLAVKGVVGHFNRNADQRAQNKDIVAREDAAEQRAIDTQRIDQDARNLEDAVETLPDAKPSVRRTTLACQRLCNAGQQQLPAACGPGAYCEAGTRRLAHRE